MPTKEKLEKAKRKIKLLTSSLSDLRSDGESTNTTIESASSRLESDLISDDSDTERSADNRNFGKRKFLDTDKPATWNVLVRVIEAKDVEAGAARVRVQFDGKTKMTRTVTHAAPKWRQNLLFTTKKESLEKMAPKVLSIKLVRPTFTGESTLGDFACYLSEVIHSTDKSVIGKWVALGISGEEYDSDELACENCGFLKISICVYRMDESPPELIDDDGTELIWSGAHLSNYTLKIRFFAVEMMLRKLVNEKKKKGKKPQRFYIQVECGHAKAESTHELAAVDDESNTGEVKYEQEIYLPIQWPTVISKITFSMFVKTGKSGRKCVGKASIPMRKIYEPGENGFLPSFGPAFLNIFDCERVTRFNWFSKGSTALQEDGSRFIARLFLSVDCVDYMGESAAQRLYLDHTSIKQASQLMQSSKNYVVFCSMSALNIINPLFASDAIQILISIGAFGSTDDDSKHCSSCTFPAMPNWDCCKYFAMPWGNLRPATQVSCSFEDIENRIELSNGLMKMTNMLDRLIGEVRQIGNGAIDHVASVGCETIDYLEQMVEASVVFLNNATIVESNNLDRNWLETRKRKMEKLKLQLSSEMLDVDYSEDEVVSKLLRTMLRMRDLAKEIADDVQLSIPPVLVKMISFGKLIGFAKIPVSEIFQSDTEARSGEWCGRTRPINIRWPTLFDQRHRKEEFVAVLHAKMWFGRNDNLDKLTEIVEPAEIRHFSEIYEIQSRSLSQKWKSNESKLLDANGNECSSKIELEDGYATVGKWLIMNTHDMWMSNCGRQTMHDKAYEVQRRDENGEWVADKYTDYYGDEVKEVDLRKGVAGWELNTWIADKLRNNGDKNGWVYSSNCVFFGDGSAVDREARPHHKYRRRCIRRSRKLVAYNKEHENFDTFRNSLDDTNWEFSIKKQGPFHDDEKGVDHIRRRRFLIEVEKKSAESPVSPIYRLYEYQLVTAKWQLRCYIMWAKDLLPVVKNSSRAFVRVSFMHYSKQTLLVDNSQNPIWNETLMFRSVLIAGGTRDIMHYPPIVSVEVVGECENNAEMHLGRFETSPTVICANIDSRAHPSWHPLRFPKGHTRGAVLACFEVFEQTDSKDCLPLEPAGKANYPDKREIPVELRPQFDKYHVQFLCWGVRNLKKHQLLSVRRPFVEMTIGDQEFCMEPLKDVLRNPNFPEPLISFSEVALPSALELSPPFVVNLFDARAFKRRPLVGTCLIADLYRYVSHIIPKKKNEEKLMWDVFDEYIESEHQNLIKMVRLPTLSTDPMVPLDWWSRYYASLGQIHRAPGYNESGMELIRVFKRPLEEVNGYNSFCDFLDTFTFVKNSRGDFDDPEEREKAGELKCRLLISKLKKDCKPDTINPSVDFLGPVKCLVRIYVIEANGLLTSTKKGRVDSYVVVKCGSQKVSMKRNYRAECADPIYGERIEMRITVPLEKDLTVTVMDRKRIVADEEIGSTTIDLENRLLSKWRATCGLSAQYTIQGEQQWRDQMTPMEILKAYCIRMLLNVPKVVTRKKGEKESEQGILIHGVTFWYSEVLAVLEKDETRILESQREKAGKEGESEKEKSDESSVHDDPDPIVEKSIRQRKSKKSSKVLKAPFSTLRNMNRRKISGTPLETIALFILRQMNLVPEHVESRPLHSDKGGRTVRGTIRMFVDLFPMENGPVPLPLNVTPRKPVSYQLRVAVMEVRGAIPVKRSFDEPVSDIYVKVIVNGMTKAVKTDTHFRVLDGSGEFNWRFVLDFDYNPWEKKIVSYTKTRLFRKPVEELVDPIVVIQLCDKNKFRKDRILGELEMDILDFMEGVGSPADVGVYTSRKRRKRVKCPKCCSKSGCCCAICLFCYDTRCLCQKRKRKKKPFPQPVLFAEPDSCDDSVNLFEARNVYGWWPMLTDSYPHDDEPAGRKKHDDADDESRWIMGLVEMDVMLLTKDEAAQDPVGKKRNEPNHSPFLEKPARKSWTNFWIMSRFMPCIRYFWRYYGSMFLAWICLIFMLILLIYILLNTWPVIFGEIIRSG